MLSLPIGCHILVNRYRLLGTHIVGNKVRADHSRNEGCNLAYVLDSAHGAHLQIPTLDHRASRRLDNRRGVACDTNGYIDRLIACYKEVVGRIDNALVKRASLLRSLRSRWRVVALALSVVVVAFRCVFEAQKFLTSREILFQIAEQCA